MTQQQLSEALEIALQNHRAGRLKEAAALYRQIVAEHPDNADAMHLLGVIAAQAGRNELAERTIRRAIAISPNAPEYHNNLGNVLKEQGKIDVAIDAYRRALGLKPDYGDAHSNLTTTLNEKARRDPAVVRFQEALRLKPDSAEAHYNLGTVLAQQGCQDQAIEAYQQAIFRKPTLIEAHNNLALALTEKGWIDQAIARYREVIRLKPDWPDPHASLAMLLLLKGDFSQGWPEYEWRTRVKDAAMPQHNFTQPQWKGEDLNGKTLLLLVEQGFGDAIQFIRYAPLVAARGGRVLLVCLPQMVRLFEHFPGVDQVFPPGNLPHFDVYCPLLSLPLIFSTRVETIPASSAYLSPDPALIEAWKARLNPSDERLKVGLAWAGRPTHPADRQRTLSLTQLAPLARAAAVTFYNLQRPESYLPSITPPPGMNWVDLSADFHDFAETAALISHLDLVITVDTAIAHLAGAMGKPAWVLLPFIPDWRWMLDRDDSPWYPSIQHFRQTFPGDWGGVIERVYQQLAALPASLTSDK